ncbi:MAG: 2-hydroxyacid dehydrogenase [Planctomycetota bacterium]|jgi:glyoxylate reductase
MADGAPLIVITRPLPGDPLGQLAAAGFTNVWINPRDERMSRSALLESAAGAHALIATPADVRIDAELFDAAGEQLVIVANYSVGVENVDLDEARRRGIIVGYTPDAVTEPTADVAWLLMLAAARRAREGLDLARSGAWKGVKPLDPTGKRVVGKTLLIVGPGRIGSAVARRAGGWNMRILYAARSPHPEIEGPPISARRVELEEGLREADFVTIHTPLTNETRNLIDAGRLALMKPSAVLVNTSRGPVVDEAALAAALRGATIFAAGLDVFANEPEIHPELVGLDNAFLMPHWGSTTDEDRAWTTRMAVENVIAALRGENVPHAFT